MSIAEAADAAIRFFVAHPLAVFGALLLASGVYLVVDMVRHWDEWRE